MRWYKWMLGLFALVVVFGFAPRARAGKLESVRSEVRSGSSHSGGSRSGSSGDSDGDAGGILLGILGALLSDGDDCCTRSYASSSPPPAPKPQTWGRFARYPYRDDHRGHVLRVRDRDDPRGRLHAGRLSVEGAYMGDGVWRSGFDLDVSLWRLSLLSDMGFYLEQPLRDALYLGGTYGAFTVVMQPRFVWRMGVGANYMVDGRTPGQGHREYAAGVGGTTRFDVFPAKPLIFSGRFDYGTLYKARTMTARVTAGLSFRGFELYTGYEVRTVGRVALYGPVLGLRAWF